jgi:MFS family permease
MKIRIDINLKDLKLNRVIRYLIVADLLFWGGWGFVNPIFSIFVIEHIPGATLATVGIATAVYWIVKSLLQIPISLFLDRQRGERDEFYSLLLSLVLAGIALLLFLVVHTIVGLLATIFLQAIAFGLYVPAWSTLFAHHLDRGHFSFDWSLDSTSIGISAGITGLVGGGLATLFGFEAVFIAGALLSFVSAGVLLFVPSFFLPPRTTSAGETILRDHTPTNVSK